MEKLKITGGKKLNGRVKIAGAKNAVSKQIIASLLTDEKVVLGNVPLNQEFEIARELLEMIGAETTLNDHELTIQTKEIKTTSTLEQTRKNRLSILLAAPLLHRSGEAHVVKAEGDKIGPRPVNFHVDALQRMGATFTEDEAGWHFSVDGRLKGASIELSYPSVGATETIIYAGVLAEGKTEVKNAAIEPEIMDMIMMLQKMGAIIELGAGRNIKITGVEKLNGCEHNILPDRLEAASYACIALATRGEVFCEGARQDHMITFLNAVRQIGGVYEVKEDGILFKGMDSYTPTTLTTDTFPGFATDWQQPFVVVLTQADGESKMHETVYEDRFRYTQVLNEMGANISVEYLPDEVQGRFRHMKYQQSAVINGPSKLKATNMTVPDIRAGLALIVAALVADGTSTLDGLHHLERGYEDLVGKLKSIGADIEVE